MRLYSVYYVSVDSSTCYGCWHPSSGARTTVITAYGTDQPGLLPSGLVVEVEVPTQQRERMVVDPVNQYQKPYLQFYELLMMGVNTRNMYSCLTPWCRVLLEKLTGLQLVKKFPAFHGTRRFITALTSVRHLSLSWTTPIQSIYT